MAKEKTLYKCSNCGATHPKWLGKCPKCDEWNTLEEIQAVATFLNTPSATGKGIRASKYATNNIAKPVSEISQGKTNEKRLTTGINEFDRVLGGGFVTGGVILLTGAPGAGKSSCALEAASAVAKQGKKVLYITGEETAEQVASRARRIKAADGKDSELGKSLYLLAESNLQNCLAQAHEIAPDLLIVDSMQTLSSMESESRVGSISQVTEVATDFTNFAKQIGVPTILIGHVTKDGNVAGPRVVEHLVDVVLMFETNPDSPLRLLRAQKNRYGSTDEIGCFEHTSEGLKAVEDPSGYFTSPHQPGTTGYATSITLEGIRALPIELQALVTKTRLPNPRKITQGIEHGRALMIQAVLDRYAGAGLDSNDVYVSTTGGLRISDPSTDLAVMVSIISSAHDIAIPSDHIFIGEVSLTGEIRSSRENDKRIQEAARLGFTKIFTPPSKSGKKIHIDGVTVYEVTTVADLGRQLNKLR